MAIASAGDLAAQARALATRGDPLAADTMLQAAAGDRASLEAARDHVAADLHARPDDWEATGALTILNRALASLPRSDPLDWRVRWSQHRKP